MKIKVIALAVALLFAANFSHAQVKELDLRGGADPQRNFEALDQILRQAGRHIVPVRVTDVSSASSHYVAAGVTGTIREIILTIESALTNGAPSRLVFEVNNVVIRDTTNTTDPVYPQKAVVIAQGGSPAGTAFRITNLSHRVTPGSVIEVGTDGGSAGTSIGNVGVVIETYPMAQ